jgi:drug/metabolite transporter (DMT)-like permease
MGIVFGVISACCWGAGDFLITLLTRRIGTKRALLSIQVLSLLAWVLLFFGHPGIGSVAPALWAVLLATAVCHVLGLAFVYRAFEVGTLSIVSPISSAFAIVTAVLSLATGERPPALVIAGAILLILGVVLATRSPSSPDLSPPVLRGVPEAILSALAFGVMFWLFYFFVHPKLGYVLPLVVLKTMASGASVLALLAPRVSQPGPSPPGASVFGTSVIVLALGAAAADTLAWLAYIWGTRSTYATVVTALASLFSVITVLLAWTFFRERLGAHQWVGVGVILLGILLVSL